MPALCRVGDTGDHGGSIATGSPDTFDEDKAVARVDDTYNCPEHGPNPIVTGSPDVFCNGRAVARIGDTTACGCTLTTGSSTTFVND